MMGPMLGRDASVSRELINNKRVACGLFELECTRMSIITWPLQILTRGIYE